MLKRIIKAVTVAITIVCLVVCMFPTYAFADVVEFTEAAKMGAAIVDIYGMANNTSLAYDYMTEGSALTLIENLYTEYSTSASDPYTLAAIGAAAAAAGAIAVVYDAITGQGYVQFYQEQYVSSLDGFWDYTLSDLGLTRNQDGYFEYSFDENDDVVPVSIPVPSQFSEIVLISNPTLANVRSDGTYLGGWPNTTGFLAAHSDSTHHWYPFFYTVNSSTYRYVFFDSTNYQYSNTDIPKVAVYDENLLRTPQQSSTTINGVSYLYYYLGNSYYDLSTYQLSVPRFESLNEGISSVLSYVTSPPAVFLMPEFYVGDPLTAVPTIDIPNVADPDYLPQPITIPTNIPWNPLWGDPLPDGVSNPVPGTPYPVTDPSILNEAVPDIWKSIVEGDVTVEPEPDPNPDPDPDNPTPDEVFNPLLPVTLPSFNFSFSGIWHYVREWVSSLSAWFTTLFLIWSKLPYAMVVPVYATAVVVIVLGVYKRFFM